MSKQIDKLIKRMNRVGLRGRSDFHRYALERYVRWDCREGWVLFEAKYDQLMVGFGACTWSFGRYGRELLRGLDEDGHEKIWELIEFDEVDVTRRYRDGNGTWVSDGNSRARCVCGWTVKAYFLSSFWEMVDVHLFEEHDFELVAGLPDSSNG